MGAGEILILLIVGIVVVGPQKLPGMMRTAGQWVSRLRRMSTDLRAQSGIDRIIRDEGLEKELRELRSLSRAGVLDSLMQAAAATRAPLAPLARPLRQPIAAAGLGAAADPGARNAPPSERASLPASPTDASGAAPSPGSDGLPTAHAPEPAGGGALGTSEAQPPANTEPAPPRLVVRPAEGTVARHEVRDPYHSFREREYPTSGCDHYDAMPDDLDEPEELEAEAAAALGATSEAESPGVAQRADPPVEPAPTAPIPGDAPSAASSTPAQSEA